MSDRNQAGETNDRTTKENATRPRELPQAPASLLSLLLSRSLFRLFRLSPRPISPIMAPQPRNFADGSPRVPTEWLYSTAKRKKIPGAPLFSASPLTGRQPHGSLPRSPPRKSAHLTEGRQISRFALLSDQVFIPRVIISAIVSFIYNLREK